MQKHIFVIGLEPNMPKKLSFKASSIQKTNEKSRNQKTITINIILPLLVKNAITQVTTMIIHVVCASIIFFLMKIVPNGNLISLENFFSDFLSVVILSCNV